jgi:type IV fimbrial biogenesis protein FimT
MRHNLENSLQRGFSLIELLVTITIAVILLTIGVPSFVAMIASNKATSYANDLLADLNYARNESITRGNWVTVCHSNDAATCSGAWSNGWIVWVNPAKANQPQSAGDILHVHAALSTGWVLTGDAQISDNISFQPTGLPIQINGAQFNNGTLTLCSGQAALKGNAITVNQTGHAQVVDGTCS